MMNIWSKGIGEQVRLNVSEVSGHPVSNLTNATAPHICASLIRLPSSPTGLILGSALIVFACVLSDECGEHPLAQPPTLSPYHPDFGQHQQQHGHRYAYGWSYLMAIAAFLGAEVSAALCLSAFLGRFESEAS